MLFNLFIAKFDGQLQLCKENCNLDDGKINRMPNENISHTLCVCYSDRPTGRPTERLHPRATTSDNIVYVYLALDSIDPFSMLYGIQTHLHQH